MRNHPALQPVLAFLLLACCVGVLDAELSRAPQALTVTSVTLNPSTIAGGSGAYTTATLTLDAPAPAGGVTVTLGSSNTDLAASAASVTVPQGATSKTFRVWTNGFYRRYSELGFTATISATIPGGGTASAVLTVTAQAMPPDILGPDSDMDGLNCGGESPDIDVLMTCADGVVPSIPGPCHKREECTLGCQDLLDNFTTLRAECSTTPPFPFLLSPKSVQGGTSVAGTVRLASPAPANTTASAFFSSIFATSNPGSFSIPTGATTANFAVATEPVSVSVFSPLLGFITIPESTPSGGTFFATRSALAWLAVVPAPGTPEVDLASLTLSPTTVLECESTQVTVTLTAPAPTKIQVFLKSSNLNVVDSPLDLPTSVVVQPGQTSITFPVNTRSVSGSTKVVDITASLTGISRTASLTVTPTPPPALRNITLTPNNVSAGEGSVGMVFVDTAAPSGGAVVLLTSGNPSVVQVPPSVTVPQGQTSAAFPVTTSPPGSTVVGVTASRGCIALQTTILVGAPATPQPPTITSTPVTAGAVGQPYSYQATATGTSPITWSLLSGPAGMAINASGLVTWTPSALGSFPVQIRAANSAGSATQSYTVTVSAVIDNGFRSPTANAADSGGDGNGFESSPGNAQADDTAFAADNNSGTGTGTSCTSSSKDRHRFFNYGFAVPTGSTINGIEVRLDARADSTSSSPKMCVQLSWDGGTTWTTAKQTGTLGTNVATFTLGSPTDTWGRTWSAANFADASFRVRVIDVSSSTSRDFFLDWVAVRPSLTLAGPPTLSVVSVSPATVVGGNPSTGTATLTAAAPAGGAVVSLSSSNTGVATVPGSVTVAAGATSATFTITTSSVSVNTNVTISGTYSGTTRSAVLTATPAPPPASLKALSLSPTSVTGGSPSTGTLTLTSAAPAGGAVVSLSSSNTAVATVPASVTIAAGASSTTFTVNTSSVTANTTVTITGTYNGVSRTASLTVTPPAPAGTLASLTLNPTTVDGGDDSIGTVTLSAPAPAGGAVVNLSSSNNSDASVPSSVTIPAGSTSRTFTVSTDRVDRTTTVTITATRGGVTKTANLTITSGR
jgi:hypothetical protein